MKKNINCCLFSPIVVSANIWSWRHRYHSLPSRGFVFLRSNKSNRCKKQGKDYIWAVYYHLPRVISLKRVMCSSITRFLFPGELFSHFFYYLPLQFQMYKIRVFSKWPNSTNLDLICSVPLIRIFLIYTFYLVHNVLNATFPCDIEMEGGECEFVRCGNIISNFEFLI